MPAVRRTHLVKKKHERRADNTLSENLFWDTTENARRFSFNGGEAKPDMKKRRVELMIETHQTWIIRKPGPTAAHAWCALCARSVSMITADEAAAIARQSTRTIYSWVEARRLHYQETLEGSLLVCLDSLMLTGTNAATAHKVPDILAVLETDASAPRDYGQEP
jgi:hypothetical protein